MSGPQTPFSNTLHGQKYRAPGESFREYANRVASALKDDDRHFHLFRDILLDQRFLPGGRIQSAMGSTRGVTPYNCYVSGTIADSFVHGDGNIMERATQAAATMRMGGGIGYDFSTLRPRGDLIRKLGSRSTGPLGFMPIYDAVCRATASVGDRRGAQMGVLRIDHPDIEEFIHVKQNEIALRGFNLSIGVTDEFMECLLTGRPFALRFNGVVYREVDPAALWEQVMRSTWDWAEPGVIFIDTVNKMNNLYYCETIAATNPCGEQPLPPFGACLLGSFNLAKYVVRVGSGFVFLYDQLKADIIQVVRAMDNVVDRALYPLPQQEQEAKSKRRMGIGVTGLATAGEAIGHPYGSPGFLQFTHDVLKVIRDNSYMASAQLSAEKGAFPLFDTDKYLASEFIKTLPDEVQWMIRKNGIRNSHLTSIAPTGTISLTADNVPSGIEPVYAYKIERTAIMDDGVKMVEIEDYGHKFFGIDGKTADRVTAAEHVGVLVMASKMVDSAVAKTCNVSPDMPWEDFKGIYKAAWEGGAKGCTTFNPGGKRMGILKAKNDDQPEQQGDACYIDLQTGKRECQ